MTELATHAQIGGEISHHTNHLGDWCRPRDDLRVDERVGWERAGLSAQDEGKPDACHETNRCAHGVLGGRKSQRYVPWTAESVRIVFRFGLPLTTRLARVVAHCRFVGPATRQMPRSLVRWSPEGPLWLAAIRVPPGLLLGIYTSA